jgi:hypothetical protein
MDINPFVSVNSILVGALTPILPTVHSVYSGIAKTYAIFEIYNRLPEQLASGKNHTIGVYGDIDVFSNADISGSTSIVGTIVTALNAAGVAVRNVIDVAYDGVSHHVLIEFYISKAR